MPRRRCTAPRSSVVVRRSTAARPARPDPPLAPVDSAPAALPAREDPMSKTNPGNFFEDFSIGQVIEHATPRTVTEGDRALYQALYPTRFAVPSSAEFAAAVGLS